MAESTTAPSLKKLRKLALRELENWEFVKEHGGQDPFWADGYNLNLIRNHIIGYNRDICEADYTPVQYDLFGGSKPMESDLCVPVPKEMPMDYMANASKIRTDAVLMLDQLSKGRDSERIEKLYRALEDAVRRRDLVDMRRYNRSAKKAMDEHKEDEHDEE